MNVSAASQRIAENIRFMHVIVFLLHLFNKALRDITIYVSYIFQSCPLFCRTIKNTRLFRGLL